MLMKKNRKIIQGYLNIETKQQQQQQQKAFT
jgi:hypothetical protein